MRIVAKVKGFTARGISISLLPAPGPIQQIHKSITSSLVTLLRKNSLCVLVAHSSVLTIMHLRSKLLLACLSISGGGRIAFGSAFVSPPGQTCRNGFQCPSHVLPARPASTVGFNRAPLAVQRNKISQLSASKDEPALDRVLSRLTSGFPFFVLSSALLALYRPSTLTWVNNGDLISIMLSSVMCGTGLTLETKDFTNVLQKDSQSVPLGVACQFIIMPAAAWTVGTLLLSRTAATANPAIGPPLFLGLCLVGCSPGGTASNLVSLIAQADVALSVILTACSTILAVVMTPLLVQFLVGSHVAVSGLALCQATARVVLGPVLLGMMLNAKAPDLARAISRFTPFASVLLVSIICGGVVAQNAALLLSSRQVRGVLVPAVLLLHSLGFLAGYFIPKRIFGRQEKSARTISIEVGMQNSALAVVLARSIGAPSLACLPGALSATAHSCLGSILAAVWRVRDSRRRSDKEHGGDDDENGDEESVENSLGSGI